MPTQESRKGGSHSQLTHQVTVKLGENQAETLDVLALLDRGKSQADLIRDALDEFYAMRVASPNLAAEMKAAHRRLDENMAPLTKSVSESSPGNQQPHTRTTGDLGDPVTFKVSEVGFVRIEALAVLDGVRVADVVRAAVAWYTEDRKAKNSVIQTMVDLALNERQQTLAAVSP